MFTIYYNNNNCIDIGWFSTEQECKNFIKNNKIFEYKYFKENKYALFFHSSLSWNRITQDLEINIDRAKDCKRDMFRQNRPYLFDKLDSLYMKAFQLQNKEQQDKIVELKQKLRDITTIDLPSDPNELLHFEPDFIKEILTLSF
jgi:hypothetical protein